MTVQTRRTNRITDHPDNTAWNPPARESPIVGDAEAHFVESNRMPLAILDRLDGLP